MYLQRHHSSTDSDNGKQKQILPQNTTNDSLNTMNSNNIETDSATINTTVEPNDIVSNNDDLSEAKVTNS